MRGGTAVTWIGTISDSVVIESLGLSPCAMRGSTEYLRGTQLSTDKQGG
jgi:hypothetical protein